MIKMALFRALSRGVLRAEQVRLCAGSVIQQRNYAMAFTFASPGQMFYNDADIKQVDVPSFSGSFGILPNHVPVLAVLKPGVVSVLEKEGATKKYFVSSGSITVNEDSSVQILAEEAVPVEELDVQACREGLSKAQQQLSQATTDVLKAEAQINIEVYEELVKAAQ